MKFQRSATKGLLVTAAIALGLGAWTLAQNETRDQPSKVGKPARQETSDDREAAKKGARREKPEATTKLDKEAVQAAVDMSKRLQDLKKFTVTADLEWEEVLENGEKIVAIEQVSADIAKPHGMKMSTTSPGRERILFYDGNQAVMWGPVNRLYASKPFKGTLAELVENLADEHAYEVPLADLFLWGRDEADIEAINAANFVGQDRIGERICDHYAYRQEGADWQLWIDTEASGLPCRYTITDKSDPAQPLFQATVEIKPVSNFPNRRFTFSPPEDAKKILLEENKESDEDEQE